MPVCQPLREAVSWNAMCLEQMEEDGLSASSWGCELKYYYFVQKFSQNRSASSWGCELKYIINNAQIAAYIVSLFVRLWVEIRPSFSVQQVQEVSLFVRLWVEIPFDFPDNAELIVSLFVRLWVEIRLQWTKLQYGEVSLFVRLWVEIYKEENHGKKKESQPLREAVSWNNKSN